MPPVNNADRDLQDEVIRYLTDARARGSEQPHIPLTSAESEKANRFARFLARRYYRDRLGRSFRYSRLVAKQLNRVAEEVVDLDIFEGLLNECLLGSLETAQRVGKLAVLHLSEPASPGPWWRELLEYEESFFIQTATVDHQAAAQIPASATSALCRSFVWNLPEVLKRLRAGDAVSDELQSPVVLLFSRTTGGRIYVVEVDKATEIVFKSVDGKRALDQIAAAVALPPAIVRTTLRALSEVGAIVLPAPAESR